MVRQTPFSVENGVIRIADDCTPEELAAWEFANNMKWTGTELFPVPQPPCVPFSISMRQCQLYLYAMDEGVTLNTINNYVLTLSVPAQIEWNTSADVWRSSPMVEQMRLMFGWTVEQMDQMFRNAEQL